MARVYKPLGELGTIVTGKTPKTDVKEYWDGDIPFITPTDVSGYDTYYQTETERYITALGASRQKTTVIPSNSVCVTCIGSTVGKSCLSVRTSITNQQINTIIPNEGNDYRYILYLLRYNLPYIQLIGGGSGSGTPIISKNKFSKFKFLVETDLSVQQRIASILSAYDKLIEINNKRIRILEKMAENLYKEWFVRFRFPGHENVPMENGLPKGWRRVKISKSLHTCSGGTPSRSHREYYDNGEIQWVKTGEIQDSVIINTEECITELGVKKSSAKILPRNTLLLAMYGVNVGKVGILAQNMACNQAACAFLPDNENSSFCYLFYFLKSIREYLLLIGFGAAQQNLSQALIGNIRIVLPEKEVILQYESQAGKIMDCITKIKVQNSNLASQRDRLLPRLMSGKLEVKP